MPRLIVALMLASALAACQQAEPPTPTTKPLVVTSFYPLWEFARQVAGDRAEVVALVPAGVEPHDWEPSPQDVARVQKARVFVYNGAGFEPWADRLARDLDPSKTIVLRAAEGLPLVKADPGAHDHGKEGKHGDAAGGLDPHVWLDPLLARAQAEAIRGALASADAPHAATYAANMKRFGEDLDALHAAFEQGLARCARRDVVVSHDAFGYLARRYRLIQVPVMGLSPDAEPSPAEMARIVRFARRQKVKYIFFETLVSPKVAETLAREVGAQTLVLDPIEGVTKEEAAAGKGYVSLMRANLDNLRTALGCR
jgi:zinc transport system substrate-binding protein